MKKMIWLFMGALVIIAVIVVLLIKVNSNQDGLQESSAAIVEAASESDAPTAAPISLGVGLTAPDSRPEMSDVDIQVKKRLLARRCRVR